MHARLICVKRLPVFFRKFNLFDFRMKLISLTEEFYQFMKENQTLESYQKINVKLVSHFVQFLNERVPAGMTFYDIDSKELIIKFLDSKLKI